MLGQLQTLVQSLLLERVFADTTLHTSYHILFLFDLVLLGLVFLKSLDGSKWLPFDLPRSQFTIEAQLNMNMSFS